MFVRFLLGFSFLVSISSAQDWVQRYNASPSAMDESKIVLPGPAGTIVVIGSSYNVASGWDVSAAPVLWYDQWLICRQGRFLSIAT